MTARGFRIAFPNESTSWRFLVTGAKVSILPNLGIAGRFELGPPEAIELPETIGGLHSAAPVDHNGDGDVDLVYHTSHRLTCYVERSFLEHGYRPARLRAVEMREPKKVKQAD